jgi:predicted ArsR family transcriptional regulator
VSSKPVPLALLGDPVRLSLLTHLDERGPSPLGELARAAGVHANTVRAHVAALEHAGVLAREHLATGTRGRPRVRYRIGDGWRVPSTDFRGLAELLAASLAALDPSPRQLQAIGQEWGGWLAGRPGAQPVSELAGPALAALGFDARVEDGTVELSGCPCRDVLPDRPELLCRLAAAVVNGLAAWSGERLQVASSVHDPQARRCRLTLQEKPPGRQRLLPLRLRRSSG